jgi:hypothetical protein
MLVAGRSGQDDWEGIGGGGGKAYHDKIRHGKGVNGKKTAS